MAEGTAEEERDRSAKAIQNYAALSVAFVCIVIGVPLWWKTTEIYRVPLPYAEINDLATKNVNYKVMFTVVVFEEVWNEASLAALGEKLKNEFKYIEQDNDEQIIVNYQGNLRKAYDEEDKILKTSTDLKSFDSSFAKLRHQEVGRYLIAVLPRSTTIMADSTVIGNYRTGFVKAGAEPDQIIGKLKTVLRDVFVNEAAVLEVLESTTGARHMQADKESMRKVRYHPGYEITFTLLNPQPDILNVKWDIETAVQKYLGEMRKVFGDYAELNIKSQYLHYTSLFVKPRKDNNQNFSSLLTDDLPRIINPIEAHLSSHVSTNPNLNFILYIPVRNQSPLFILDSHGEPVENNAFLSPRWGGVLVYNSESPQEGATLPVNVEVDMDIVMATFVSQLRLLLGVNTLALQKTPHLQPAEKGISDWEMDQWLRSHAIENLASSTATLTSLIQLLEEVGNIVINDNIGKEVDRAVTSLKQTHSFLIGGKLKEAFLSSRQAIISSEQAFFDSSLLELLYFPEDQKFAIYIPLFLPISIPVAMSLMQAFKWYKAKKSTENTDKKND